jgi:glycosyltransferase involved in cell wall biosynthesis
MRCLVLSRYGLRGASSRVRFAQYFDALSREGIECRLSPLLPDAYLPLRYRGDPRRYAYVMAGYVSRVGALLKARTYDVVWVEGELFPGLPAAFESLLAAAGVPYVVDYDDALFHKYDRWSEGAAAWLYRGKFQRLLVCSAGVTAGNAYLETLCRQNGAQEIERVPSVVDIERYEPSTVDEPPGNRLVVGWIGSPTTTKYLHLIESALGRLASEYPLVLMTIGAGPLGEFAIPVEPHLWTFESEVKLLNRIDIGVMPLDDEPWERGKCGYKLIQYMALAKPVVASPVGVNAEIVSHGTNGFLATSEQDWFKALHQLAASHDRRCSMGMAGRARVIQYYSVQAQVKIVAKVLRNAAAGRH